MKFIDGLYSELENVCNQLHCAAAIWGSCIRDEITPYSDIDIIVFLVEENRNIKTTFIESIQQRFPEVSCWDISFATIPLMEFADANGTNYHSVFFSARIVGDLTVKEIFSLEREIVRADRSRSIREFFNLFTSYWGLAHVITPFDERYSKFGINGTNKWVRLFQASQIRWQQLINRKSVEVLSFLCERYNLDYATFYQAYSDDFKKRVFIEEQGVLCSLDLEPSPKWTLLFKHLMLDSIKWIQQEGGISPKIFYAFLEKFGIESTYIVPVPAVYNTNANAIVSSFVAESEQEILELYRGNLNNWWVLTNLCINPKTSSDLLDSIVFPNFPVDVTLWKSIRLYVAKNINTREQTLERILATKGLREQDYKSAKKNLNYKSQMNN